MIDTDGNKEIYGGGSIGQTALLFESSFKKLNNVRRAIKNHSALE